MNHTPEHTPEPWHIDKYGSLYTPSGQLLLGGVMTPMTAGANRDTANANARRIVAAVNACAGLPTESLEKVPHRNGGPGFLNIAAEALQEKSTLRAALQTQAEEAAKLVAQRDGLLIDMRRARNLLENGERAGALNCLGDAITNATEGKA